MSDKLTFVYLHPDDVTGKQFKEFKAVVETGGESFMKDFEYKLLYTVELLGFCYSGDTLVGVRALKVPGEDKVRNYMQRAGIDQIFKYELGYAAVIPEARGKGIYRRLTEGMLGFIKDPVYIVTRKNNYVVIDVMLKMGFSIIGHEIESAVNPGRWLITMYKDCSVV